MFNTILTFTKNITKLFSMIMQNITISVALTRTQGQTSKKSTQNLNITKSIEVCNGYLPPVTAKSDVIGQYTFRLVFGLELVLIGVARGGTRLPQSQCHP